MKPHLKLLGHTRGGSASRQCWLIKKKKIFVQNNVFAMSEIKNTNNCLNAEKPFDYNSQA